LPNEADTAFGPFYPAGMRSPAEVDLTAGCADVDGERIVVDGSIVDVRGTAIVDATVEIWHADAAGRYAHPIDRRDAPGRPPFIGYGRQCTDARGRFAFVTIRPGPYPLANGSVRASHVHFQVTARYERLVTQMFFAGDPLNATDPALLQTRRPEALIAAWTASKEPDDRGALRIAQWNIVMTCG
jgi:protocatechuate 3,4-dioxygenase beta subunit